MDYGQNIGENFRRAATYIDKIPNGNRTGQYRFQAMRSDAFVAVRHIALWVLPQFGKTTAIGRVV